MSASSEDAYWNAFYAGKHPDIETPSTFAQHVLARLSPGSSLFELGCGNGRDALYFADRGLQVTACDRSKVAIAALAARPELGRFLHRPTFLAADFADLDTAYVGGPLDAVYSRFTLHAVPVEVQHTALGWARRALRPGGQLLIEVRSVLGSLYGKGEPAGDRDAFIHDGHYRRFLRMDELQADLVARGFSIADASESAGVAVYKDDDPVVIRLAAVAS
ncbi:MAG: class I SAM-dependent methyltransferase [Kofleriaceae bacterium]|jgi:SAM-dependent methyltransferase|nr:class I SAM-dependent methyltransferase [Kofleriaceae bacterium]MBP6836436.1 class I SAM-dependent methyltransferase [Kofleriaceae bacterium]